MHAADSTSVNPSSACMLLQSGIPCPTNRSCRAALPFACTPLTSCRAVCTVLSLPQFFTTSVAILTRTITGCIPVDLVRSHTGDSDRFCAVIKMSPPRLLASTCVHAVHPAPGAHAQLPVQEPAKETEAQKRAREDELVSRAEGLRREHTTLALAYDRPNPEPARCVDHQGALLKEMRFLALDFSQVGPGMPASDLWPALSRLQIAVLVHSPLQATILGTACLRLQLLRTPVSRAAHVPGIMSTGLGAWG